MQVNSSFLEENEERAVLSRDKRQVSKEQSMMVHQQLQGTCFWPAELCQIFGNSQVWHKKSGLLFLSFFPSCFFY